MPALLRRIILLALIAAAVAASPAAPARPAAVATPPAAMPVPEDRFWDDQFGSPDTRIVIIHASAIHPSGDLYVGGVFGIKRWDGRRWHDVGADALMGIRALAFVGDTLYAGGSFTTIGSTVVNQLARWDGASWSGVGGGVAHSDNQPEVAELLPHNGRLYVRGHFDRAGGLPASDLAVWDGSAWAAPEGAGAPGAPANLSAMAFEQGRLYLSSTYSETGKYKSKVAGWDGQRWTQLGPIFESSTHNRINDIHWYAGKLYLAGGVQVAGESAPSAVARWDGAGWQGIGTAADVGLNTRVMMVRGGLLYFGGYPRAGQRLLATWNGSAWGGAGPVLTDTDSVSIYSLAQTASTFYLTGLVETLPDSRGQQQRTYGVAQLQEGEWRPVGNGLGVFASEYTIITVGDLVYISELFAGTRVWNGRYWRILDRAFLPGPAASDGRFLYAQQGATVVRRDGEAWAPIGAANGAPAKISGGPSGLYVTGALTAIDGVAVRGMARWNGSAWSATGDAATNGAVTALHVTAGGAYLGGAFTTVGIVGANRIARWDGSAWRALGAGIPEPEIVAIVGSDSNLYVKSRDASNTTLRRWDGSAWSTIITLSNSRLRHAMAELDGDLIVSGDLGSLGGVQVGYIARWDGAAWHPLGSGLDQPAFSLATSGHNLYAGGSFATAGGLPSYRFAHWNATRAPIFIPAVLR